MQLPDMDFDTGRPTQPGEYALAGHDLRPAPGQAGEAQFDQLTPELRANIVAFYRDPNAQLATKRKPAAWQKTQEELQQMKVAPAVDKSSAETIRLPFPLLDLLPHDAITRAGGFFQAPPVDDPYVASRIRNEARPSAKFPPLR